MADGVGLSRFSSSPLLETRSIVQRIEAIGLRERVEEQCASNNRRKAIANLIHDAPTPDPFQPPSRRSGAMARREGGEGNVRNVSVPSGGEAQCDREQTDALD